MTGLKKKRIELGLTAFALAMKTGIREGRIGLLENRREAAYPKYRRLLADFYGVDESELFDDGNLAREVFDE
jgi:transcriptional regulator with XRE-family HTH domain